MALLAPVVVWGAVFVGAGFKLYKAVKRLIDPLNAALAVDSEEEDRLNETAAELAETFIKPLSPQHRRGASSSSGFVASPLTSPDQSPQKAPALPAPPVIAPALSPTTPDLPPLDDAATADEKKGAAPAPL